jgi:hypothetical protein
MAHPCHVRVSRAVRGNHNGIERGDEAPALHREDRPGRPATPAGGSVTLSALSASKSTGAACHASRHMQHKCKHPLRDGLESARRQCRCRMMRARRAVPGKHPPQRSGVQQRPCLGLYRSLSTAAEAASVIDATRCRSAGAHTSTVTSCPITSRNCRGGPTQHTHSSKAMRRASVTCLTLQALPARPAVRCGSSQAHAVHDVAAVVQVLSPQGRASSLKKPPAPRQRVERSSLRTSHAAPSPVSDSPHRSGPPAAPTAPPPRASLHKGDASPHMPRLPPLASQLSSLGRQRAAPPMHERTAQLPRTQC